MCCNELSSYVLQITTEVIVSILHGLQNIAPKNNKEVLTRNGHLTSTIMAILSIFLLRSYYFQGIKNTIKVKMIKYHSSTPWRI